jgi:uncharacterized protein DUF5047
MIPSSATYKQVLPSPHKRVFRIDVTDIDGTVRASNIRPFTGSVTASLTQRVTRQASFTLGPEFYPASSEDALSPEFAVAHIQAGIQYGDGSTEMFPIFMGRVDTATVNADGSVDFNCYDLAADVVAFPFEQPRTATSAMTLDEIRNIILEAVPQATFGTDGVNDTPTPQLTWDEDRGQALDELAQSVGGRWYTLGDGSFVVRNFSYTPGPVVATYTDGPRGMVTGASVSRTRAGAFNEIIVVSERTDGSDPVRVPARVNNPANPLFFGGKYGKVAQIIKVNTPLSTTQAQTLAQAQLSASGALRAQWDVQMVPDMSLEPGDTVSFGYRGNTGVQIIDRITYPLDNQQTMTVTGRAGVEPQ